MENFLKDKIIISAIILLITLLLMTVTNNILKKTSEKYKTKSNRKGNTYINIARQIVKYSILIIGVIWILQINNIDVSSLLAGLGIVSVITGFALQDALKDLIMGFNIMADNYFSVGDVIKIDEITGKVIYFGLKSTKIKDIENGNILAISNRNIDRAIILSTQFDIDIPLEYEENLEKAENTLNIVTKRAKENKKIHDIQYVGINEFADSSIKYKLRIWCEPEEKFGIKRYVNRLIIETFNENNITIPYTQIDIHSE